VGVCHTYGKAVVEDRLQVVLNELAGVVVLCMWQFQIRIKLTKGARLLVGRTYQRTIVNILVR